MTTDEAYHTCRDFELSQNAPATKSQLEAPTPTTPRRGQDLNSEVSTNRDADVIP